MASILILVVENSRLILISAIENSRFFFIRGFFQQELRRQAKQQMVPKMHRMKSFYYLFHTIISMLKKMDLGM